MSICVYLWTIFLCFSANAQTLAPGSPGKDAQWASAGKQGVGTSASLESKVWFTLQDGALTEVYYPDVTIANVHLLQFVVVNPKTKKVETERDDANHKVETLETSISKESLRISNISINKSFYSASSLAFRQINWSKTGDWSIFKTYITDPKSNSVLISVNFQTDNPDLELYVYYDPSLGNSGMHDTGWIEGRYLLSADGQIASALTCGRCKFSDATNGFLDLNDGLTQLRKNGKIVQPFSRAENGNLVQVAKVTSVSIGKRGGNMLFALGFGNTPQTALMSANNTLLKGYEKTYREYQEGWLEYLSKLPKVELKYQAQFNMAAMILKAHEDKANRGANIASLSVPWGGGDNANENNVGGYHLVWARDLYQVATAFMALGDKAAAERALDFLFKVQQKADGGFPQNSWLDGKPFWGSLQLDEVAFPLILAYQLGKDDKATYENHVKRAADFIVKNGPKTPQERWEEEGGYSPSTIAAEIAGLVCAADIAQKNGDNKSAELWLKTADEWRANIEKWTATTTGKYGDGNYYLRITQNGKPNEGEKIELNNGAGFFDEREIVDAGFLELVRLGIKSPDDELIKKSVNVIDQIIRVETPNGDGFYRYNHDGYGEMDDGRRWNWDGKYTGKGRLWALLSGERGQYELARFSFFNPKTTVISKVIDKTNILFAKKDNVVSDVYHFDLNFAKFRLDAMLNFANEGLMIPEQVWDKKETPNADSQFSPNLKFGEGTGSATPLAWSMAQFIRLAVNLQKGRNLDTPDVVYNRYVLGKKIEIATNVSMGVPQPLPGNKNITDLRIVDLGEVFDCTKEFERMKIQSPEHSYLKQVDGNWSVKMSPYRTNQKAVFFYQGDAKSVELAGDFSAWKQGGTSFQKIPNTNVQCFQLKFASTARVEYKLIIDGKWIIDPLNPNKIDNGVGSENSFFAMPEYKPTVWDKGNDTFLDTANFKSEVFNGVRLVQIYAPSECVKNACPTLYFQDGSGYIKRANAVQIQQNLVKAGKVKPFIMVFIDPKDRTKEYWASDDYAKFLATEVVPAIDAKYNTIKSRDGRAILGASLGGITSVHTAVQYPEIFSRVGGQSSSFWIDNERVVKELEKLDAGKIKFKFYFDDGTLEGVEDSRRVNEMLRGKGFDVTYVEGESGHNWTSWRDRLADAFIALWK